MKTKLLITSFILSVIVSAQTKKVLLEEFSGAHCGQCPMGSYMFDSLLNKYPNLIGISLHSYIPADAIHFAQIDTIATPYAPGAPLGAIDRINFNDGWGYVAKLYQNWDAHVQTRLAAVPTLSVSLTAAWNSTTRNISAQITADILANMPTGDYRFTLYVVEDSVTGTGSGYDQSNLFTSTAGNPFYGMGDPIIGFIHRHVVRAILPASWGQTGIIASIPIAGQNFSTAFNYVLPASYNENRIKLVGFVSEYTLNHQTDEVFNVAEVNLPLQTGMNEISLTNNFSIFPNPANQSATFKFDTIMKGNCTLTVYNSFGQQVKQIRDISGHTITLMCDNLPSGLYFVRLTENNKTFTDKLIITDR